MKTLIDQLLAQLVKPVWKVRHDTINPETFELFGLLDAVHGIGVCIQATFFGEFDDKRRERRDVVKAHGAELYAA